MEPRRAEGRPAYMERMVPGRVWRGAKVAALPVRRSWVCSRVFTVSRGYREKSTVRPASAPASRDRVHSEGTMGGASDPAAVGLGSAMLARASEVTPMSALLWVPHRVKFEMVNWWR